MSVEKFITLMEDGHNRQGAIDTVRVKEIIKKADELGVTKMFYEHPGQAAWRHRWDNVPGQPINVPK